jgi:hypothetical protein
MEVSELSLPFRKGDREGFSIEINRWFGDGEMRNYALREPLADHKTLGDSRSDNWLI